ncbi:MAG: hypothetical protein ACHQ4H_05440 [Ktedonobacterales bacterium]
MGAVGRGGQTLMGNLGWDDDSWRRNRSARDVRSPDAGRPGDRAQGGSPRGSSRGGWDDPGGTRGSGGNFDRSRGPDRDRAGGPPSRGGSGDDGRGGSSGRRYDRGGSERSGGGSERSGSRGRPPGRDEYDMARPNDRSMRGPRPPSREDAWDPSARSRMRPAGPPGVSSSRNRPPGAGRAGLWEDDSRGRRPVPGAVDGRRPGRGPDPRDPRGARRPMGGPMARDEDEDDDEGASLSFGKAVLIILGMLVLGVVVGFGYFRFSAPKVPTNSNNNNSATPAATTPASPTASASPHALVPHDSPVAYVLNMHRGA